MRLTPRIAPTSHGQWLQPLVKGRAGLPVFCMRLGTVGYGWVWLSRMETSSVLSWCRLSRIQSGEPDARCQLPPRVDNGGTHRSTLNATEPGKPVSLGLTQRCLNEGQPGEPDAEPSHMSKASLGGTHRSVFDATSPGDLSVSMWVRGRFHPEMSELLFSTRIRVPREQSLGTERISCP